MATPKTRPITGPDAALAGARVLVVEARFHAEITAALWAGAERRLAEAGAVVTRIGVPGALEIPTAIVIACDAAAAAGNPYDGVLALGCVIRGDTFHFEIVAGESARALLDLSVARALPLGNGILTVDTETQAIERADPAGLDKGGDAAAAMLALVGLMRRGGRP